MHIPAQSTVSSVPARGAHLRSDTPTSPSDQFQSAPRELGLYRAGAVRAENQAPTLPRPLADDEREEMHNYFPVLNLDTTVVTAEATPQYNCISWTTGNTQSWDWPPQMYPELEPREAFGQYYAERGFAPVADGSEPPAGGPGDRVAYWENDDGPTHGSVAGPGHGDRWESKCGAYLRVQHGRDELESDIYGHIAGYYTRTREVSPSVSELSADQARALRDKLNLRLQTLDAATRGQFQQLYSGWQSYRKRPEVAMSADPSKYCQGEAYRGLMAMGPRILPLLVDKMSQGDFFCRSAVETLTHKPSGPSTLDALHRRPALKPETVKCSEQAKANQILEQWLRTDW